MSVTLTANLARLVDRLRRGPLPALDFIEVAASAKALHVQIHYLKERYGFTIDTVRPGKGDGGGQGRPGVYVLRDIPDGLVMVDLDLRYLQDRAFQFSLDVNPGATYFQGPEIEVDVRDGGVDDWLSEEQRAEAYRTGRYVTAQVYPCGSVGFFFFAGTDMNTLVAAAAWACWHEQERWRAQDKAPHEPQAARVQP